MRKYVIMGIQGSGKGTQARMLHDDFDLVHISAGDIFRWHIQNHTKLGAKVRRILAKGELVPDDLVWDVIKERLHQHDWNYGFVLDGFPRNDAQARLFLETYDIDAVIHIEVPDDSVFERMLSRRLCSRCGLDYNLLQHRPKVADTCDVCGGQLRQRPDDTPDAIRERLSDYHAKTRPILALFRQKELVIDVDGTLPPAEVQDRIRHALDLPAAVPA